MVLMSSNVGEIKEEGNKLYKAGSYVEARDCYKKASEICEADDIENLTILLNNIAICDLKLNNFDQAIDMTTKCLKLKSNDSKALYRRCMAYESLGKMAEAFKDAKTLYETDNKFILPTLIRLKENLQEKNFSFSTERIIDELINKALTSSEINDKKKALEQLILITNEKSGAEIFFSHPKMHSLADNILHLDSNLVSLLMKIFQNVCFDDRFKAIKFLDMCNLNLLVNNIMLKGNKDISGGASNLLCTIMAAITGMKAKEGKKGDHEKCQEYSGIIDAFFGAILKLIGNPQAKFYTVDQALNLIIQLVDGEKGLGWSYKLIHNMDAIPTLLHLASRLDTFYPTEPVTNPPTVADKVTAGAPHQPLGSTFSLISLALYTISEDMISDAQRNEFRLLASKFVGELLDKKTPEANIRAIKAITCLLQGPFAVGDSLVGSLNIVNLMLQMSVSKNEEEQVVALEAIILTASSRKRCQGVLLQGVPILKGLYKTGSDAIKIRALVGICKLGSSGGFDSSLTPFEESSNLKLAESCKSFIEDDSKKLDMKRWAAEGLAYLSFNADIKEFVIKDDKLMMALLNLAKNQVLGEAIVFPMASLFVNLTNSYDKPKIEPELLELAVQAKQHIPVESPKDAEDYVQKRLDKLMGLGIVSALIPLCKTESLANRELLSRIFSACAKEVKHRGTVIQQGGAKALLSLALNNTPEGRIIATQALARITITNNPEIVFGGEKYLDLVRPLLQLLYIERTGLQNYEALMALTNIASTGESARRRILLEKGMTDIVNYLYEEHSLLRRASAECLCNLMLSPEFVDKFCEVADDRIKMLGLVIADTDDIKLQLAAAGALCSLINNDTAIERILEIKSLMDILKVMLMNESVDMQYRGALIVRSLVYASKKFTEDLINSDLYYALVGMSQMLNVSNPDAIELHNSHRAPGDGPAVPTLQPGPLNPLRQRIKELAVETFEKAKEYGVVNKGEKTNSST